MGLPENCIPEDKLPQCWSDDVRMNALFAPFRIKAANPESWDMKMKFWTDMLRQWCKYKKDPIVSASDAKYAFQRNGRTPACLEIVIEEMLRSGEVSPVSKYSQLLYNGPEGWVRWGARLALKPAALAVTAAASLLGTRQALDNDGLPKHTIDATHRFVLESAVKEQAQNLLETYPSGEERIGTIDELMRRSEWGQGRETFEVLLGWLVAQGAAVKKNDVIKLAEPNKKVSPVSERDEALVRLAEAEGGLRAEAARLAREAGAAEGEARAAVRLGSRAAAKNHLRKKHKAQQRLDKCESALENVRLLLQQMRDVDVNAAIVDTYRTSSEAMKRGMKQQGLDADAVHDTMDDLKDVLESYSEVERALSASADECDAAELERELRELLAGPAGRGAPAPRAEPTPPLPTPPTDLPKRANRAPRSARPLSEREFVFDGEERVIAELEALSVTEDTNKLVADNKSPAKGAKVSKSWYPPLSPDTWNNNIDFGELRQDDRLHPGQPLNVELSTPPKLYTSDFCVRDHKPCGAGAGGGGATGGGGGGGGAAGGVWLYNGDPLGHSTEYTSTESPGKSGGTFQMAPGGERKSSAVWAGDSPTDDLERRLRNLRGFNL